MKFRRKSIDLSRFQYGRNYRSADSELKLQMARWIGPRFRKPREIRHPSVSLEYLAGRRFFVSHSSHVPTPLPGLFEKKAQKRQEEETGVRTFNTADIPVFCPRWKRASRASILVFPSRLAQMPLRGLFKGCDILRLVQTNVHSHVSSSC